MPAGAFIPSHTVIGAPDATFDVVLLHGILGSRQNWRSFVRDLVERRPRWRVITPDHRHHGDARGAPPPDTLEACAEDLARLLGTLDIAPKAVIGHSFGGKVAMTYAGRPDVAVEQVWVLDAVPGAVEFTPQALSEAGVEVAHLIATLAEIPQPLPSRQAVVGELGARGFGPRLAAWMTTNLRRDKATGGYVWRFDLPGVEALLRSYLATDLWPFVEDLPLGTALHVVRAGRSTLWTDEILDRLAAAAGVVRLHLIEDAGHWLHADAPEVLARLLEDHLPPA